MMVPPPQPKGSYPLEVKDVHDGSLPPWMILVPPPHDISFRVADEPFLGSQMTRTYGKV